MHNSDKRKQWLSHGKEPQSIVHEGVLGERLHSVWWNFESVVYLKLVPNDCAVIAELYCELSQL